MVGLELVELVLQLVDPSVFDDQLAAQQLQLLTLGSVCSTELLKQTRQYNNDLVNTIIHTLTSVNDRDANSIYILQIISKNIFY